MGSGFIFTHLFIFILCALQVYYISLKYLEFSVVRSVSYEMNPIITRIPAITVCSVDFVREEENRFGKIIRPSLAESLLHQYKGSIPFCINKTAIECLKECRKKFNLDSLSEITFRCVFYYRGLLPHELISSVTLANGLLPQEQMFYDTFFWFGRFCYTLNNKISSINRSSSAYIWITELLFEETNNFYFATGPWKMAKNLARTVEVEFYPSSPTEKFESTFVIGTKRDLEFLKRPSMVLVYKRIEENKLPSPYTTNCFNFSQVGLTSQNDCINKCILNYFLYVGVPVRNFFDSRKEIFFNFRSENDLHKCVKAVKNGVKKDEKYRIYMALTGQQLFSSSHVSDSNFTAQCLAMIQYMKCKNVLCTKPDCKNELFPLSIDSVVSDNRSQVTLMMPSEHDILINSDPSFFLTDFFIYVASTIAFWYGLDAYSCSKDIIESIGTFLANTSYKNMKEKSSLREQEEMQQLNKEKLLLQLNELVSWMEARMNLFAKMTGINLSRMHRKQERKQRQSKLGRRTMIRVSTLIYCFLSALGMTGQLYQISFQYLTFDVNTEVSAELEDEIILPVVSLCFLTEEMSLYRQHKLKIGSTNGSTPNELMTNSFDTFSSLVQSHEFAMQYKVDPEERIFIPKHKTFKFLRQGQICYSIDLNLTGSHFDIQRHLLMKLTSDTTRDSERVISGRFLTMAIPPDVNDFSKVKIIFSQQVYPKGYDVSSLGVERFVDKPAIAQNSPKDPFQIFYKPFQSKNHRPFITSANSSEKIVMSFEYTKLHRQLMPWPYVTDCLDRTSQPLKDRGECYEHCLNESVVNEFSSFPIQVTLTRGTFSVIDHSRKATYQRLRYKCKDKCQKDDCNSVSFVPKEMYHQPFIIDLDCSHSNSTILTQFNFYISDNPNILVHCSAKIIFIDFITFVLGCPCFWFGVAPLPLLVQLINCLTQHFSRKIKTCPGPAVEQFERRLASIDFQFDSIFFSILEQRSVSSANFRRCQSC